jgi:hypothetical protein
MQPLKRSKNSIKDQWLEPSHGRQKKKAKEKPKDTQLVRTKKWERVSLDELHMRTKCPMQLRLAS